MVMLQTLGQQKLEHLGPAQTEHPGPVKNLGAPKTVHILSQLKNKNNWWQTLNE